jgi:type I restriction enzyme S subunit
MTAAAAWRTILPWLAGKPDSWEVLRFKHVCRLSSRTNTTGSEALLSLSVKRGVLPKKYGEDEEARSGSDLIRYWTVSPNQLVVNPMWLAQGAVAASEIAGVTSPDYRVYDIGPLADPRFLHHLLRSREYRSLYSLFVRGDTTYDRRVSKDDFVDLPIVLPPKVEQRRIAEMLDGHARSTREIVALKEAQLSALEERYSTLVAAITDPYSGSNNRSPVRLGTFIREVKRPVELVPTEMYREVGVRSHGRGLFEKEPVLGRNLEEKGVFRIEPGDLVFNIVFAWEGAVAAASSEHAGLVGSHRFPTFRAVNDLVDVRFLALVFRTPYGRFLLEQSSPGAAGRNKTLDRWSLLREKVCLPDIEIQRRIGDELDTLAQINTGIRQTISLMDERLGSSMSEVLSGTSTMLKAA